MKAGESSEGKATSTPSGNKTNKKFNSLFTFWFDTLSGNRTRVKGVEDPHSTTELSALVNELRIERKAFSV